MVDALDTDGDTALHKAVKGSLPAMHHLLKSGANPNLKNKRNVSPFELAQKMKRILTRCKYLRKITCLKHDGTTRAIEL